ncbi:MAG: fatty acid kinase fatty acid binding subunit [Solirubrobacteraceae bacterium]|nr:fatty acid kinase fatty acid binding subunit [Solirubrobacteraceae bacterium]
MRPVTVVTDSTHYLPDDLRQRLGIVQVSLYVSWGDGQQREAELPGYDDFYARLRTSSEVPTTSQPSVGDFVAAYEPVLAAGGDVVSIHISGGISGTCGAARQAKALIDERGGDGQIIVIDTETACGGLACLAMAAATGAGAGEDAETVAARVRDARTELKIWFSIDTLEFLRRGGRIGNAQAWLGGALKIKPILSVGHEITPVERVRTSGRAFERMVEYMRSRHDEGADCWVIQHIQDPEKAARLVERGREIFGSEPWFVSELGPVIGTYTGPGMIGVGGLPIRFVEP